MTQEETIICATKDAYIAGYSQLAGAKVPEYSARYQSPDLRPSAGGFHARPVIKETDRKLKVLTTRILCNADYPKSREKSRFWLYTPYFLTGIPKKIMI